MDRSTVQVDRKGNRDTHPPAARPLLAGVEVREDDIEPQKGLHVATVVIQGCALIIFAMAIWQLFDWWTNRPPGGAGMGVVIAETVRLVVFSGLLWAASSLADVMLKTHNDVRAGKILLARQTYMMRLRGIHDGILPVPADDVNRRRIGARSPETSTDEHHPDG